MARQVIPYPPAVLPFFALHLLDRAERFGFAGTASLQAAPKIGA
jgi:hypothetical protein